MTTAQRLAKQYDDTRAWTKTLLADFQEDDWTYQPGPGLHHALWLCGHLATAAELLVFKRCLGQESVIDAEFRDHFAIGGPVKSAAEHEYPPARAVLDTMNDVHKRTVEAIRSMSDELLAQPAYAADGKSKHPHYDDKHGVVVHLARHEAFHAGQIALLRRLIGKSFLR